MSIIDLAHLRYFYAVATEGNFTRAARKLFVGQPVVSQMVINLEAKIGARLFERQKRSVLLTRAGTQLFHSCQKIFGELAAVEKRLQKPDLPVGNLRFGATEVISAALLPKLHRSFLARFPDSDIYAASGPAYFLADLVLKNQIDFALVGYLHRPHGQLETKSLAEISHHIVVRSDVYHDRKKWDGLTFISSRQAESDITDSQPALQKVKKLMPKIQSRIVTNNRSVHKSLVLDGAAVAILPSYLIRSELKSGKVVDLVPGEKLQYSIQLLHRKSFVMGELETWYTNALAVSLTSER